MGKLESCAYRRIALFGGSYDPIHLGHLAIARAARNALELDLVVFIPCRQSPHKNTPTIASQEQRLKMLDLALAGETWATTDDLEFHLPEPSFSWVTAEAFLERYPGAQLYWLMGADQWMAIDTWDRPSHLSNLVQFIVHDRGHVATPQKGFRANFIHGHHPATATLIREQPGSALARKWLHPDVVRYIREAGIYA